MFMSAMPHIGKVTRLLPQIPQHMNFSIPACSDMSLYIVGRHDMFVQLSFPSFCGWRDRPRFRQV